MDKYWKLRERKFTSVEEMLTTYTGTSVEELLNPTKVKSTDIENMSQAGDLIRKCVEQNMPVTVVGDYDADGVTSSCILKMLFSTLGSEAQVIIPKRFTDGYGISEKLIADIKNSLIVCVDNGITGIDAVELAKSNSNTVIILDHHQPLDVLPVADIIVDPHINPENNAFYNYCGAGLALKLAEYMLDVAENRRLFYNLTVLACIGTIADVMPILGDNRRIVMDGLKIINNSKGFSFLNSGIQELLKYAGLPCDEEIIAFQIAPVINAVGRMYNAGSLSALKTLLCDNSALAVSYAQKLQSINDERKKAVYQWLKLYQKQVDTTKNIQILYQKHVPEGIIGIIAGKIAEIYHVPTIIFTDAHEANVYKGSGRSNEKFDLTFFISAIRDLTIAAGSHAGAAGLSIPSDNFEKVKQIGEQLLKNYDFGDDWKYTLYDMELNSDNLVETYRELQKFTPFGEGIRKPIFVMKNFAPQTKYGEEYRLLGNNRQHIKLYGKDFDCIGFNLADKYNSLNSTNSIDLIGRLSENRFNNRTTIQFVIDDISL